MDPDSRLFAQVHMALDAATRGKRTLICVRSRERAVAVREEFGLVGNEFITVIAVDEMPRNQDARHVTFVSYDETPLIAPEDWTAFAARLAEDQG